VLFAAISAGRPSTVMPAWGQANGGPFTDEEIRDIVTFIRAWEPTAPVVQTATFVPNPARGAAIYTYGCYICHGEDGKGGSNISVGSTSVSGDAAVSAPAVNVSAQLSKHDDEWYRQMIINGRPAKGMPSWGGVLSSNQVEDLISMIAAWRNGERVVPEITVAELLNSALYSLKQNDPDDALFYLERASASAFGPALNRFPPIIEQVKNKQIAPALADLDTLSKDWPIGDATNGETIFMDTCKGCHGAEGQGGVGRKLKPNTFIQTNTNADLFIFVRTGRPGTAMRSFAGTLSESQLADVIAFLRTWQP
ncbi:MAG: c-type cytochrome, partial [Chloroflexi bacterium]|nr:c-type cytochrome [Chloroflexota bacterium]